MRGKRDIIVFVDDWEARGNEERRGKVEERNERERKARQRC